MEKLVSKHQETHLEFLTRTFWIRLRGRDADSAAYFAYVALSVVVAEPKTDEDWLKRGDYALKLYAELMADRNRSMPIPQTKYILWKALLTAWSKAPDQESALPFSRSLAHTYKVLGDELTRLNTAVAETAIWPQEWRLIQVLEEAASANQFGYGEYPFVDIVRHMFVKRPDFIALFRRS